MERAKSPMAPRVLERYAMNNSTLPQIGNHNLENVTGGAGQTTDAGMWSTVKTVAKDVGDLYDTWKSLKNGWGPIPAADPPGHTKQR
jgi:hypothetical protein